MAFFTFVAAVQGPNIIRRERGFPKAPVRAAEP
jgi:hypothetical protein